MKEKLLGTKGTKGHRGLIGKPGLRKETLRQAIKRVINNAWYSVVYYRLRLHRRFKFLEKWY